MKIRRWGAILLTVMFIFGALSVPLRASAGMEKDMPIEDTWEFIKKIGANIGHEVPGVAFDWGMEKFLDYIFGLDDGMSDEEAEYFHEVLTQIEQLQTSVDDIQRSLNAQSLAVVLNTFKDAMSAVPANIFYALKQAESLPTKEARYDQRVSILTTSLGMKTPEDWADDMGKFDLYAEKIKSALLDNYSVILDGQVHDYNLLRIQTEYMRRKYYWEHHAVDEWLSFQSAAAALLFQTLTIEKYSLELRIKLLDDYNKDNPHPISNWAISDRLDRFVLPWLEVAKNLYGETSSLWAVPHDRDNERYYWYGSHSILFDAHLNTQLLPRESSDNIGYDEPDPPQVQGIKPAGIWTTKTQWPFWKPFFRPTPMLTEELARMIYKDYGERHSFYEIFISEDQGGFLGLNPTTATGWWLVIDPEYKHLACTFHPGFGPYSENNYGVSGFFLDAGYTGQYQVPQEEIFARYYASRNWIYHGNNYISLHVKSVGDDTFTTGINLHMGMEEADAWTPADGDLELTMDEEQGKPLHVMADGIELKDRYYTKTDKSVKLSASYLSTLSNGLHSFVAVAENGELSLTCRLNTQEPTPSPRPVPHTGDSENPALMLGLVLLGIAVLAVLAATKVRSRR